MTGGLLHKQCQQIFSWCRRFYQIIFDITLLPEQIHLLIIPMICIKLSPFSNDMDRGVLMIRQFVSADADACCGLVHACLALDSRLSRALYSTLQAMETPQAMRRRSSLFYMAVYESSNAVLGVAGLDMNEVRLLYVSPQHQSQGIGRALLNHLETMVPSSMFTDIFVYSTHGAAGFYSRCGFKSMGDFTFDVNGHQLQTTFMIKLLNPSLQEPQTRV